MSGIGRDAHRLPSVSDVDRVDVGVVVALALEASAIRARLESAVDLESGGGRISVGRLGGATTAVITAGVGAAAAIRATRLLVDGHRPVRIIAAGLCGGLDPAVGRGTVIVADRVATDSVSHGSGDSATNSRLMDPLPIAMDWASSGGVVQGLVITTDHVVKTAEEKKSLRESTGAVAVDMESWWVIEEATRAGIPAHAIRAVCDTAVETLPDEVASLAAAHSPARMAGLAIRLLCRRPAAAVDLIELRGRAHAAARSLARHLASVLGDRGIPGPDRHSDLGRGPVRHR